MGGSRSHVVVVVAMMALATVSCAVRPVAEPAPTPSVSESASSEPDPSPTPSPEPTETEAAPPPRFVAWSRDGDAGRIEVRSTKTGAVMRVLTATDSAYGSVTASAETGMIYYASANRDGVYSLPLAGGSPERISDGGDPVVSPDGRWLVFGRGTGDDARMVVRDLRGGDERTWRARPWEHAYGEPGSTASAHGFAWMPDSRHLLYQLTTGDPAFATFMIDRTEGDDVLDGTRIDRDDGDAFFHLQVGPETERALAIQENFHTDEPDRIMSMSLTTGRARALAALEIATVGAALDEAGGYLIVAGTRTRYEENPRTLIWDVAARLSTELASATGGGVDWID